MSVIKEAEAKGWTIEEGTLQARGLWHAFRNNAETDDDVTLWCTSKREAAEEALNIHKETKSGQ